jgi:hypothetical protein
VYGKPGGLTRLMPSTPLEVTLKVAGVQATATNRLRW